MAFYDDPKAAALNLPPPPPKMKWRVCREEQVRALAVEVFNEWCHEMQVRFRLYYPSGTFNPRPIGTGSNALRSPYYVNLKHAADRLKDLQNFHPGFPDSIE